MKINWEKLWIDFDEWANNPPTETCKTCKHTPFNEYDWFDQQRKIEQLVAAQLRKRLSIK